MERALVMLCVFSAGCIDVSVDSPLNEEVAPPTGSDSVLESAQKEWHDLLDFELLEMPVVRWFAGDCLRYASTEGGCITAIFLVAECSNCLVKKSSAEIHILADVSAEFWTSELVHELLHDAFWTHNGDEDRAHTRDEWDLVDSVVESIAPAE